jgi:hypothetical protein
MSHRFLLVITTLTICDAFNTILPSLLATELGTVDNMSPTTLYERSLWVIPARNML